MEILKCIEIPTDIDRDGSIAQPPKSSEALSARLSEKDASLASLQANKLLCGRCGMWNAMGCGAQ